MSTGTWSYVRVVRACNCWVISGPRYVFCCIIQCLLENPCIVIFLDEWSWQGLLFTCKCVHKCTYVCNWYGYIQTCAYKLLKKRLNSWSILSASLCFVGGSQAEAFEMIWWIECIHTPKEYCRYKRSPACDHKYENQITIHLILHLFMTGINLWVCKNLPLFEPPKYLFFLLYCGSL